MKKIRVAINGYGRIGRSILRALYERQDENLPIQIVAINGAGSLTTNAHLTKYDTTHGKFKGIVSTAEDTLRINNQDNIQFFSKKNIHELPWKALDIDIVYECTGQYTEEQFAKLHINAGAKKVLIASPSQSVEATIVYGINHTILKKSHYTIASMASCTTNAFASIIKPLENSVGIKKGVMTTIHAYTSDQRLLDNHHSDLYRARSATQSMIPTKTGAAATIGKIFPSLQKKIHSLAIRVPVPNVSLIDFSFNTFHHTDNDHINHIFRKASVNALSNTLAYNDEPLVSMDFNHHPASAIVLAKETTVVEDLVKVLAWYDNEWAFSNRMLDITMYWFS